VLTPDKLEKMHGHAVSERTINGRSWAECDCNCGNAAVVITAYGDNRKAALIMLRDSVLSHHRWVAMGRANWCCERCGRTRGLSGHHRVFRSHGRDDRVANLSALCEDCHEGAHRSKSAVRRADIEA
jgi:5-methylcytosine-specific restriction endonuclease McrA